MGVENRAQIPISRGFDSFPAPLHWGDNRIFVTLPSGPAQAAGEPAGSEAVGRAARFLLARQGEPRAVPPFVIFH